jgi:hypothetical protein
MKMNLIYLATALSVVTHTHNHAMEKTTPQPSSTSVQMVKSIIAGAGAGVAEVCLLGQICSYLINQCIPRPGMLAKKFSLNPKLWKNPNIISLHPKHLYKGVGVNAASMAPITAIQNMVADQSKKLLQAQQQAELTPVQQLIPPVFAGATAALCATPAELLPNYMQRIATDEARELSTRQAIQEVCKKYGMRYLWRGLLCTMLRDGWFTVGYKTMPQLLAKPVHAVIENKPTAHMVTLIAAGVSTAVATQPAHVIARYMQNNHEIRSSLHAAIAIMRHYGICGLWKGGIPRGGRIMVAIPVLSEVEKRIADLLHS